MSDLENQLIRPIRVVMFGSGPALNHDAKQFLCMLEDHPEIEFLGAFCQAESQSWGAIIKDLWRRRGFLVGPLLIARVAASIRVILENSRQEIALRRRLAKIARLIYFVDNIHSQDVLEQVSSLEPDLGLIYGSPILRPKLFEIPRYGTLGIHHGKLPEYRGNKTTFWAMFNGETTAGVTIQNINAGLDTGSIVREGNIPIGRRSYLAVVRDLEALGLNLYIQAILQVKNGTATFRPQTGCKGKLYRNPKLADFLAFWVKQMKRRLK